MCVCVRSCCYANANVIANANANAALVSHVYVLHFEVLFFGQVFYIHTLNTSCSVDEMLMFVACFYEQIWCLKVVVKQK